jgi:hypothetical protein
VSDTEFHPLLEEFVGRLICCADIGFHSKAGDSENVKICERGTWKVRQLVKSVFSLLTRVCHSMTQRSDRLPDY